MKRKKDEFYLGKGWLDAFGVVGLGAVVAEEPLALGLRRFAADDAVALAGGLVAALVAEPVTVWNVLHLGPEAVRVVALVAAVAQQQLVLLVSAVAELATRLALPNDNANTATVISVVTSAVYASSHIGFVEGKRRQ